MYTHIHAPKSSSDCVMCVCSVCRQRVTKALGNWERGQLRGEETDQNMLYKKNIYFQEKEKKDHNALQGPIVVW